MKKSTQFMSCLALLLILASGIARAQNSQSAWAVGVEVPEQGRANILNLPEDQWMQYQNAGKIHAQIYPVSMTGILIPYRPMKNFIESRDPNSLKDFLNKIIRNVSGFKTFDALLSRLGLHQYPKIEDEGVYQVPYPGNERPQYRMGFGLIERDGVKGFTVSCAGCHTGELFGKKVLGLTNRFPRANDYFVKAKAAAQYYNEPFFRYWTRANAAESAMMNDTVIHLNRVAVKQPIVLGLDTSLAQVSLSLNLRAEDEYATPSSQFEKNPRHGDILETMPADSKPAVWWNTKYKNRWLSDGSVISGNPIFTNLIWNEIGRGTDLRELEMWLVENKKTVDELASTVFGSKAPVITDFFPAEKIDLGRAKIGEEVYNDTCARCHGVYEKAWNQAGSESLPLADQLKTTKVIPKKFTPVKDVGTDPNRRLGMKSLEKLNALSISQKNNVVIKAQPGYVPPPLVGIWARWPYMHNNSIPNLCALLTPAKARPSAYYAGEARKQDTDFDFECNGYPLGAKTPANWKEPAFLYDTRRPGMSNSGHDEGILIEDGKEVLSTEDKKNLIMYLQTL